MATPTNPVRKNKGSSTGTRSVLPLVYRLVFSVGRLGKRRRVRLPTDQQHGDATQDIETGPQVDGRSKPQNRQGHKAS